MRKLLLILLLLCAPSLLAQQYRGQQVTTYSVAGTGTVANLIGSGSVYHQLIWNVSGGTLSACQVKLEQSATGTGGWSDLIANQTCTSNGTATITSGTVNYIRVNVGTFTVNTGTPTLTVNWTGYAGTFGSGIGGTVLGGITGQLLTVDSSGNLAQTPILYADQFAGADWCAKIQAAHDALPTTGGTIDARGIYGVQSVCASGVTITKPGTILLLGTGTYPLATNSLTFRAAGSGIIGISSGSSAIGTGAANATKITYTGVGPAILFTEPVGSANGIGFIRAENFTVEASGGAITSATAVGFECVGCNQGRIDHIGVNDFEKGNGVLCQGSSSWGCNSNSFTDNWISGNKRGLHLVVANGNNSINNKIRGGIIGAGGVTDAAAIGLDLDTGAQDTQVYDVDIEGWTTDGQIAAFVADAGNDFFGVRFDDNCADIRVAAAASNTTLFSPKSYSKPGAGTCPTTLYYLSDGGTNTAVWSVDSNFPSYLKQPFSVGSSILGTGTTLDVEGSLGEIIRAGVSGTHGAGLGVEAGGADFGTGIYFSAGGAGTLMASFDSNHGVALGAFAAATTPPPNGLAASGDILTGDPSFGSSQSFSKAACETNFGATTLSGASTTTGLNCLPANAIIDAVVYRITATFDNAGHTVTSFTVGDSGSATRYCGTQSTVTIGTTGLCLAAGYYLNVSATGVKITPNAVPTSGAIRFIVYYHTWIAPAS